MDNRTNMVSAKLLQNMRNHKYDDNNDKTQEKQHKTKHIGLSFLGTVQQLNRMEEMNKIKTETVNL